MSQGLQWQRHGSVLFLLEGLSIKRPTISFSKNGPYAVDLISRCITIKDKNIKRKLIEQMLSLNVKKSDCKYKNLVRFKHGLVIINKMLYMN